MHLFVDAIWIHQPVSGSTSLLFLGFSLSKEIILYYSSEKKVNIKRSANIWWSQIEYQNKM